MRRTCLLLVVLLAQAACQTLLSPNSTLAQALSNSSLDADLARALLATFETHPELENYTLLTTTVSPSPNNDSTDYAVTLAGRDRLVEALVTITATRQAFLVNFKTILSNPPTAPPNLTSPARPHHGYSAAPPQENKSIILQAISYNPKPKRPTFLSGRTPRIAYTPTAPPPTPTPPTPPSGSKYAPLGSYRPFTNLQDPRFWLALQFLATLHPHLLNYQVADVQYQIVLGINFLIKYSGLDKLTEVTAKVNINLKLKPTLLNLSVSCTSGELCVGDVGEKLFLAVETLIKAHPELLDYSLISLQIEQAGQGPLLAMVGFEQTAMRVRVLSNLKVEGRTNTILSFYSYLYE